MKRMGVPFPAIVFLVVLGLTACQKDSGPTESEPPVDDSIELGGTVQDLPAALPAENLKVLSGFDSTIVGQGGTFRIPVSRSQNKAVLLVDQTGQLRHVTFFPARVGGSIEMSAKETAVSLIMMNPLLMPDSPELALEFRQLLEGRSAFTDFRTTLQQKIQGGYAPGSPDQDLSGKLSLVYEDLYQILHQRALERPSPADYGPIDGITLHMTGDDPSTLQFQVINGRKRWVSVWGMTHTPSGGYSAAGKLALVPAPNVSILELILHGSTSETATSSILSLPKAGRDFARIDCYGLGVNPNLTEEEFNRALEPALYTVVFDFSLPITSLLAGTNLELQGDPAQHPFKQIVDLMPQECPDLAAQLHVAMREQDSPAVYAKLVECYVTTLSQNPEVFADAARAVITAANGGTMPRSLVKRWLFPVRLVSTALGVTNLSWVFASTLTSDVVTTFRADITAAPVYDATVEGKVLDARTDAGLAGVEISIATADGVPIKVITTNAQGDYSTLVPAGTLVLDFTRAGYFSARQEATTESSSTTTLPPTRLAAYADEMGTVGGKVIDAQTGFGLPGATVRLLAGFDPEGTEEVATTAADGNGIYQFASMRPGSYTAIASKAEYITQWAYLAVVGGVTRGDYDITLSRPLGEGYRFVLTWGESPLDIDSHLLTPPIEGTPYEVRWNNRGSLESLPFANLDVDDQDGYGPETTTIAQNIDGTYHYAVYQWSSSGTLLESQARVVLYSGDQILRQWTVPSSGAGTWWYVCDLNAVTGAVQSVNRLQADPPTGMSPSLAGKKKEGPGRTAE
jgi:hypothetical protein